MSCNFYKNSGVMVGIDLHTYHAVVGVLPDVPIPFFPHVVAAPLAWPATWWKRTGSVQADGFQMIQGGFDIYFVPHVPIMVIPPASSELRHLIIEVISGSGSKAQLQAHSVTGEGNPLATCMAGAVGLNVNCFDDGISAFTGIVVNPGTVKTTPTAGDYAGAVAAWAFDCILGYAVNNAVKKVGGKYYQEFLKHLWRRIGDIPYLKVVDVPSHVQNFVQRVVDGASGEAGGGL